MMLLLCAITSGVWADETVTFNYADYKSKGTSSSGSEYTMVKDKVSIKDTKFYGNNSQAHFYANGVATITPATGVTIKKVVITTTGESYNGYQSSGSITASTGTMSHDGAVVTWTGSATAAFTLSHNKQIRWTTIVVTYEEAASFNITATANDDNMGSVSVSGSTITASPNDGYRVKSGTDGYDVTSGTATVVNNEDNTFSVTPTTDCSITINFEAIPSHTLSYVVNPVGAGTVALGATSVMEGKSTTISATANAGYKFRNWTVTGAELGNANESSTTVTMGTTDAEVTANFDAVVTHAITWSVNGNETITNVEEDAAIDFSAPSVSLIPTGYTFIGWSESEVTTTNTKPATVDNATCTSDATYYAVFAIAEEGDPAFARYEKVTTEQSDWSGTYLLGATYTGGSDESKKGTFVYSEPASSKKYGERVALTPGTEEKTDYEIVIAKSTNGYTIYHPNSATYFRYNSSDGNNSLGFVDEFTSKEQEWTITGVAVIKNANTTDRNLQYNGSSPRFACYTTNQTPVALYKRIEEASVSYSGYCTIATPKVIAAYADGWMSYVAAADVEFPSEVEAYIVTSTETGITREKVTQAPKDTPLVLHATDGAKTYDLTALAAAPAALTQNKLKASDGTLTVTNDNYKKIYVLTVVGDEPGFGPLKMGSTLKAGKVYLEFAEAQAKDFIGFGEETTAIETLNIEHGTLNVDAPIYNLAGQRVGKEYKGLVIVNGKKIVRK